MLHDTPTDIDSSQNMNSYNHEAAVKYNQWYSQYAGL